MKMCTNDIASKLNHWEISPNYHQIEENRRVSVQKHFKKLSELFVGNIHVNFEADRKPNNFLADAAIEVDRRTVDLKGLEKLTELCLFLRNNVDKLKSVFKTRRRTRGGYYTESEIADLAPELRSLDKDVRRMMDTLNSIVGNRREIKQVLKMYTEYEDRYVRLRSLNKNARLRYQAGKTKTKNDTSDDKSNLGVCETICKWVLSCPFNTTQDNNFRPADAEGDVTIDRGPLVLEDKEKLTKLCSFLKMNVINLINYYEIARQRVSGTYYAESENADLGSGLLKLKDDVEKLLDTLNDISGYRSEVKHVLDMYTEQEARYRSLRLLNTGATLRHKTVHEWRLGLVICKLVPYFQGVSVNASINTLMAISVERCLSICYPMSPVGKGVCKRVVAVIWIISLTITMPWAIYFDLQPMEEGSDNQICLESWPTVESGNLYFVLANLLLCYVLPLTVIAVCYMFIWQKVSRRKVPGEPMHNGANMVQRSKMKVITMIMYVVVLFAVSWLPLYVAFSLIKFWPLPPAVESYTVASLPVAQWLGAANSSINPLLYAIFNHRFRDGYRALLSGKICQAFDYSNSVRYLRGGRAGTVAAAAFKRTNNNNNDKGRCDRNRKTIGAIYVHAARSQLQQHTAQQRRPVPQQKQRSATQQLQPPTHRLIKSSSVRETHVAEVSAGSVVQFCPTNCENSFV